MATSIHFTVSFPAPQTHYAEIEMNIQGLNNSEYVDVAMPVWAPGSYLIREYSKNVERFQAFSTKKPSELIKTEKVKKNVWRIFSSANTITIKYAIYAFEVSVRTSFIDDSRAFLSPVGTFMFLDGHLDLPSDVTIDLPNKWTKISTGLAPTDKKNTFYAPNFDVLFDAPFEIGNQDTWQFDVEGTLHECAMVGPADYDKDQLTEDITKIVKEENKIWGSNPNDYYLFVTHNYQNANGGLEHLNSTILATSRFNYKQPIAYKNYLSLVAHEYFHLWNVKRLRPKALGPFNYHEENYTYGLWIMEGFTSYYDNLIIRRCGFYDEKEFLQKLAVEFNAVYNRPGYLLQSAAQSSFDTWIKQYRPDENSQNTSISYYNKGAMHAVALDIFILAETQGKIRLDDVIKAAYQKFYLAENRGFEESEFLKLAEEVTSLDLEYFFKSPYDVEEIDYNKYFNRVGYQIIDQHNDSNNLSLGIKIISNDGKTVIKNVDRDSTAWFAGLNVDDELIAVENYRLDVSGKALDYCISQAAEGDILSFLIARDGIIKTIEVPLLKSDKKSIVIESNPDATKNERLLGDIWLSL